MARCMAQKFGSNKNTRWLILLSIRRSHVQLWDSWGFCTKLDLSAPMRRLFGTSPSMGTQQHCTLDVWVYFPSRTKNSQGLSSGAQANHCELQPLRWSQQGLPPPAVGLSCLDLIWRCKLSPRDLSCGSSCCAAPRLCCPQESSYTMCHAATVQISPWQSETMWSQE